MIRKLIFLLVLSLTITFSARAADWPMWRGDARHSGVGAGPLAGRLHLQWVREYPRQKTAWLDQPLLIHDRVPEPVVRGTTLFFGSARDDTLTAIDTRSGAVKWSFPADGPIRYAPVAWEDRVYFASDDGHLYCLDAATGKLVWKFRGGPSDRKILGNGRLISAWPARGAPVIADGTVYFAASIWPFMGIFIHALDARSGAVIWTNDGDGSIYMKQPHNADSFAGVAPQGTMAVSGDYLLIPGGRSVPACYDRRTGKLVHYKLAENSKLGGGPDAILAGRYLFNGGAVFDLGSGAYLGSFGKLVAAGEDFAAGYSNGKVRVLDVKASKVELTDGVDRKGAKITKAKWTPVDVGTFDGPKVVETMIRVGDRLYFGSPGEISCLDLPRDKAAKTEVVPVAKLDGTPASLLSADDRLFAVTLEGRIYCFGPTSGEPKSYALSPSGVNPEAPVNDEWSKQARSILDTSKVRDGYCVAWGAGSGRLVLELLKQSHLHVIVVERDADKALQLRRQLTAAGLYGERAAVHVTDPLAFALPPYLASLMVAEDAKSLPLEPNAPLIRKMFESLRPYGGAAFLPVPPAERDAFQKAVAEARLANARTTVTSDWLLLSREGALPGAANWTHEHGDPANTRVSRDDLVKAPLGLLWFGGSSHQGILPRHGHGPQPQVIDGRLIIEGVDLLRAVDIYTGRVLWETNLPNLGKYYNNMAHQPGANATGTNYISTSEGIYVVHGKACLRLDPATGKQLEELRLPAPPGKQPPAWGYVNVADDYLVGGADPLMIDPKEDALPRQLQLWDVAGQKVRLALEGHTDYVTSVAFSPDGRLLATASNDRTVRVWHTTTGKLRATLAGHAKRITCVAFSPDGHTLASGCDDHAIFLWDVAKAKPTATLHGHTDGVLCLAFSPDGKTLISGSADASIRLWEVESHRLIASYEDLIDDVTCLAYAPDGKTIAAGSADATVKLWDVASGQVRARLARRHTEDITSLAFTADGRLLATGSKDRTVRLWDAAHGKHVADLLGHTNVVTCLAFAPDGKTLAAGTHDATIRLWDVEKRTTTAILKGQPGSARSLAFAPDGHTLAMGGVEIWSGGKTPNESLSSSKHLIVMNRKTGTVLWTTDARSNFRHNAICIGGGRLFAVDKLSAGELSRMKRRGIEPTVKARLVAFDLRTGKEVWSTEEDVFGTWLSYSEKYDVLIEAGRMARDTLYDEPKGMRAFQASSGTVLWQNKTYGGPAMIHGDTVLKDQSACDLLTGKPKLRTDPVTGQPVEWTWTRDYGCNTPAAAQHLLTFRSGAAGYFDLAGDGGTGNFGGFRSSCTNNLIVAGGVLNAPDYTRTCTCSYQNQSSLALVPMPEVEIWTRFPFGKAKPPTGLEQFQRVFGYDPPRPAPPVKHLALNLGAPGCRRAPDGRLWLNEYEHAQVTFERFGYYNGHSSKITAPAGTLPWVASSGCRGITQLEVALPGDREARYTVRLHFADPDNEKPGQRIFDVRVQEQTFLTGFDIARETGGRNRAVVKEIKGVVVRDKLVLRFTGDGKDAMTAPLLCGLELLREGE